MPTCRNSFNMSQQKRTPSCIHPVGVAGREGTRAQPLRTCNSSARATVRNKDEAKLADKRRGGCVFVCMWCWYHVCTHAAAEPHTQKQQPVNACSGQPLTIHKAQCETCATCMYMLKPHTSDGNKQQPKLSPCGDLTPRCLLTATLPT